MIAVYLFVVGWKLVSTCAFLLLMYCFLAFRPPVLLFLDCYRASRYILPKFNAAAGYDLMAAVLLVV